jgi:flagellar hook-basal body complex protein FliE
MTDPLGLLSNQTTPLRPPSAARPDASEGGSGPKFTDALRQELEEVNQLQREAKEAAEDFSARKRDDVEAVIMATEKADAAFKLLLAVRNKLVQAVDELKQTQV